MSLLEQIIPKQKKGSHTGATSKVELDSRLAAIVRFDEAKKRIIDINNWYKLCGKKGAEFTLTDENGIPLNVVMPKIGNLIRIKLPAPPNPNGEGYDWVRIEKVEEEKNKLKDEELFGFRVRPVQN
ncbi:MAG: Uncharacterized protein JWO32_2358, partial [Bacteroidetes bacterium]|nr:Uncharacterized protein [Bacteroidota bacterium]